MHISTTDVVEIDEETAASRHSALFETLDDGPAQGWQRGESALTAMSGEEVLPQEEEFRKAGFEILFQFSARRDGFWIDYLIFVSDGIPEAANAEQEMFGDERIQATIRQGCSEGLSAEALIDRLLAEVRSFCGEVAQEDDMTCVVVRVTG